MRMSRLPLEVGDEDIKGKWLGDYRSNCSS
jgi:hypothetical protein